MNNTHGQRASSIIYLSHGGGPLPILGDPGHDKMIEFMKKLPLSIPEPDEILVISAHWEENMISIIGSENPGLLYDYYGFPEEAYNIKYPVEGNPDLATKLHHILDENNYESRIINDRGLDHGVFIPLKMMYPQANIPTTQISLKKGLNPEFHLKLGEILQSILDRNILVIGSGFSFHNMREFMQPSKSFSDPLNDEFQDWLISVCASEIDFTKQKNSLIHWVDAPSARYCHPREEHLIPLHVCAGMAQKNAKVIFDDVILGKRAVAFQW